MRPGTLVHLTCHRHPVCGYCSRDRTRQFLADAEAGQPKCTQKPMKAARCSVIGMLVLLIVALVGTRCWLAEVHTGYYGQYITPG